MVFLYILFASLVSYVSSSTCSIDGPLLPRPQGLKADPTFQNASSSLKSTFEAATNGSMKAGWNVSSTSFAVAFISLGNEFPQEPIWSYSYRSPNNVNGTSQIDGDSQWLIGSISKLFTDLILLKSGVDTRVPITKYLPPLASNESFIDWQDVTLESLASHLAGIPQNYGFPEIYQLDPTYEAFGLPHIPDDEFPPCGITGLNNICTEQQLLLALTTSVHPNAPPNGRPVYSSLAFTVIAYALRAATNQTFGELLSSLVTEPMGLANTGLSPGNTAKAVVPPVKNSWGGDYGDNAPGGGLFSSFNDLSKLAISILDKTVLPKPADVRKWLNPVATVTNTGYLVGLPWEIYRTSNLTPKHPHTIDIYAKDGGAYGYVSRIGIIDQYGLGFIVLTAGDTNAIYPIAEAAVSVVMPAVEEVARQQASKYIGLYSSNTTETPASMRLVMDDQQGIRLDALIRNGSDVLAGIKAMWNSQPVSLGNLSTDFRLYPADIESRKTSPGYGNREVIEEDWRMTLETISPIGTDVGSQLPTANAFANSGCTTWQTADYLYYGAKPVDRFVFIRDVQSGEILGAQIPFLHTTLDLKK